MIGSSLKWVSILTALMAVFIRQRWEHASTPLPSPVYPVDTIISDESVSRSGGVLAEIRTVPWNGQLHYLTVRSRVPKVSKDRPTSVLLILHGGPGASDIPFLHQSDSLLEEHFVVVHYDQRSAGKSCRFFDPSLKNLTTELIVDDAVHMVRYLMGEFDVPKIYLLGGSWGSILALLLAKEHPNYFYHVGVRGLVVDMERSERLSRQFVLDKKPEFAKVVPKPPPYGDRIEDMVTQRKWLTLAGGQSYRCNIEKCTKRSLVFSLAKAILTSPEMSWGDTFRFERCFIQTLKQMWPEVEQYKALERVPKLEVPLLVLHGRYDYCTVHTLVEEYVDKVEAPSKTMVWFEKSGHSPQLEEADKFQRVVIEAFAPNSRPVAKTPHQDASGEQQL